MEDTTIKHQNMIKNDYLEPFKGVVDAAILAAKKIKKSSEGAAKIEAIQKHLNGDTSIDIENVTYDLILSPEFESIISLAAGTGGIYAIGLGATADYALIKGHEVGAEGIIIFPSKSGASENPTKFATRTWNYETEGIEIGAGTGICISLWFAQPSDSDHIVGCIADLSLLFGFRLDLFGAIPKSNLELVKNDQSIFKYVSAVSIGVEVVGLEFSLALIKGGTQKTNLISNIATLDVINDVNNTAAIVIGEADSLTLTLLNPLLGSDPCILLLLNKTTLKIGMPAYMSACVWELTVTDGSGDWKVTDQSGGYLNLIYIGEDQSSWSDSIVLTISGAKNNSSALAQKDVVTLSMKDFTSERKIQNKTITPIPAPLPLVAKVFKATFNWSLTTIESDFKVTGSISGTIDVTSPPDTLQLIDGLSATFNDGTVWSFGYLFAQLSSGEPYVQAFWTKEGKPYISINQYKSDKFTLVSGTSVTATAYYEESSSSSDYFQISAVLN